MPDETHLQKKYQGKGQIQILKKKKNDKKNELFNLSIAFHKVVKTLDSAGFSWCICGHVVRANKIYADVTLVEFIPHSFCFEINVASL